MNQPTFTEGPPVPMMVEGLIDTATLSKLFTDLETAADVKAIREKAGPVTYAESEPLTVRNALSRLLSGAARSQQIHYSYDGRDWTDTVISTASGFRVVRCLHQ